jgi:hypothetical protein
MIFRTGNTELALNFYDPGEAPVFANANATYPVEVAIAGCPQPTMVDATTETSQAPQRLIVSVFDTKY